MSEQKKATLDLWAAVLLAVGAASAIGLCTLLIFKWGNVQEKSDAEVVEARQKTLAKVKKEMSEDRNSYQWISRDKGIVQIPVEQAMKVMLKDLKGNGPHSSGVSVDPGVPAAAAPASEPVGEKAGTEPAQAQGSGGNAPAEKSSSQEGGGA